MQTDRTVQHAATKPPRGLSVAGGVIGNPLVVVNTLLTDEMNKWVRVGFISLGIQRSRLCQAGVQIRNVLCGIYVVHVARQVDMLVSLLFG